MRIFKHVFAVRQSLSRQGGNLKFDDCLKEFAGFYKFARFKFMKKTLKLSFEEGAERFPGIYTMLVLF